ncbi:hypothetical protein TBLA_0C04590 [Henningerozyma blattae CBS 6284]|uniref:Uncharacterized protein n=1 Tax=Henningerozyma blattae (strain ATCC 34711 / CBS 6284 / DSM 70876 / NBRC 10599 / NRRL Y-10934 / UCD 77-7) TaxID=1071380 RepID=I2H1K3_HENB6|nr:hypothetical protein TBLA_0C04590 [Tetrapisispora blattae CBS 6284]CCH60255.1 hypothetical protein TBLA_0C04590 [Tetrapisispora blattae CBS 6284]
MTRAHRSAATGDSLPFWHSHVTPETIAAWTRLPSPNVIPQRPAELGASWHYHLVIAWFYRATASFTTSSTQQRPLWPDVTFDEALLHLPPTQETLDTPDPSVQTGLLDTLRLRLLQLLASDPSAISLAHWDTAARSYLPSTCALPWESATPCQQYDMLYYLVHEADRRRRSGPLLNLEQLTTNDGTRLLIAPSVGALLENRLEPSSDSTLSVPIRLRNCTIAAPGPDLLHLDYAPAIDSYLAAQTTHTSVLASDWDSFVEYTHNSRNDKQRFAFLTTQLEPYLLHLIHSCRLLLSREKAAVMDALLARRKRSSRLAARENGAALRQARDNWDTLQDNRTAFLKTRHRALARHHSSLQHVLSRKLWDAFDKDVEERVSQIEAPPTESSHIEVSPTEVSLTGASLIELSNVAPVSIKPSDIDQDVLLHGTCFHTPLLEVPPRPPLSSDSSSPESAPLEIPAELALTADRIARAAEHGLEPEDSQLPPDTLSWTFQCLCDPEPLQVSGPDTIPETARHTLLVCCDACHVWQHWDCQPQALLECLMEASSTNANANASVSTGTSISPRDFAAVQLGSDRYASGSTSRSASRTTSRSAARRSSRRHASSSESLNESSNELPTEQSLSWRPTEKRPRTTRLFVCGWCVLTCENDIRGSFANELALKREKEYEQAQRKQKRAEEKLLKEKLKQQSKEKARERVREKTREKAREKQLLRESKRDTKHDIKRDIKRDSTKRDTKRDSTKANIKVEKPSTNSTPFCNSTVQTMLQEAPHLAIVQAKPGTLLLLPNTVYTFEKEVLTPPYGSPQATP